MSHIFASFGISPELLSGLTDNLRADDILPLVVRLTVIGLLAAGLKAYAKFVKDWLFDAFFPTAHVDAEDPAFTWIMAYLAQHEGVQSQLHSFRPQAADSRQSKREDRLRTSTNKKLTESLLLGRSDASFAGDDVVGQIAPLHEQYVRIWFKGNILWIRRSFLNWCQSNHKSADHLRIQCLWFQRASVKEFLLDVHAQYYKKSGSEILIFHASPYNGLWYDPISRPSRTWPSVILEPEVKDSLLEDVRGFMTDEDKEWYAARGIPHRRGYLLHGRPGSGKTTLATAIASQLKLDIYVVNPAARGMDDGKLNKTFRSCPPGNMILIEDIDCIMPKRTKDAADDDDDNEKTDKNDADPGKFGLARSTVTLSGLLNAIDGVSSQEDCILFATTNHPERLDEALCRPGRFDVRIAFQDATHAQAHALFRHFYPVSDRVVDDEKHATFDESEQDAIASAFANSMFPHHDLLDQLEETQIQMRGAEQLEKERKKKGRIEEKKNLGEAPPTPTSATSLVSTAA